MASIVIEDKIVMCPCNNKKVIVFDTNIEDLFIPIDVNAIERIVLNIL